jgi:hypothetical protein
LENQPAVGGIAILKITVLAGYDVENANVGCFLPQGLRLVNDKGYKVILLEPPKSEEPGTNVKLYSGIMKKGESKEIIFRVLIIEKKKYLIGAGGLDGSDYLEIDLGDPEPPEWKPEIKKVMIIDGKRYLPGRNRENAKVGERSCELIELKDNPAAGGSSGTDEYYITGIKYLGEGRMEDLILPVNSPPPFRTEFKKRTKDRPYYYYHREDYDPYAGKPILIPFRYLVYTENETPDLKASLIIPKGLEFVSAGKEQYQKWPLPDGGTKVLLYSGPMHFNQSKAFYFKIKPPFPTKEEYVIRAKTELTAAGGKKLLKEDTLSIDLRPKR